MADSIHIAGLALSARVGVPDVERSVPQRLSLWLALHPKVGFAGLGDEIGRTVDYFQVCERIKSVAAERPRKLIETLAQEIAETLLAEFPLASLSVEVRKFILPDTEYVAVRVERSA